MVRRWAPALLAALICQLLLLQKFNQKLLNKIGLFFTKQILILRSSTFRSLQTGLTGKLPRDVTYKIQPKNILIFLYSNQNGSPTAQTGTAEWLNRRRDC